MEFSVITRIFWVFASFGGLMVNTTELNFWFERFSRSKSYLVRRTFCLDWEFPCHLFIQYLKYYFTTICLYTQFKVIFCHSVQIFLPPSAEEVHHEKLHCLTEDSGVRLHHLIYIEVISDFYKICVTNLWCRSSCTFSNLFGLHLDTFEFQICFHKPLVTDYVNAFFYFEVLV